MPVAPPRLVDVRGPRFAAWVTSAVLAVVLLTGNVALLAVQAVVFALGAFLGLRWHPYGALFRALVGRSSGAPRPDELTALVGAHTGGLPEDAP